MFRFLRLFFFVHTLVSFKLFYKDTDLRAYDRYVGKISPPPKFVLLGKKSDERFSPQELDCFQTVQITELNLNALEEEEASVAVEVLQRNRQNPVIQRVDTLEQLELFWEFKVMVLDTIDLFHPDWNSFISSLIRKHASGAIGMLRVNQYADIGGAFTKEHEQKLRAVGLKFIVF